MNGNYSRNESAASHRSFHLQSQQIVRARSSEVDGRHRDPKARCLGKAEAGIDHQRETNDQHGVGDFQVCLSCDDLIARNVFAVEHDIGLEDTAAGCARRYGKRREIQ